GIIDILRGASNAINAERVASMTTQVHIDIDPAVLGVSPGHDFEDPTSLRIHDGHAAAMVKQQIHQLFRGDIACHQAWLCGNNRQLTSTALLVPGPTWYPPHQKEDSHGRACESGCTAGAERVFGGLPDTLQASGGGGGPGAIPDGPAHRAAQQ